MVTIKVRYFASLREAAKRSQEDIQTESTTASELYSELRGRYAFNLDEQHVRPAINDQFASMDTPLNDGDSVVFIPPVAGG